MHIHLRTDDGLILRRVDGGDARHFFDLDADPQVRRHLHMPDAPTLEEIECGALARVLAWHARSDELGYWWVHDPQPGDDDAATFARRPAGWVCMRTPAWADDPHATATERPLEIGWRFFRDSWGHGLVTRAMAALIGRAARELGTPSFHAMAMADNDESFRVMERLGMRYLGRRTAQGVPVIEYAVSAARWRDLERGPDEQAAGTSEVRPEPLAVDIDVKPDPGPSGVLFATARERETGTLVGRVRLSPAPFQTESGGTVIAVAAIEVDEAQRGRRIGSRLVRAGLAAAADAGYAGAVAIGPGWFLDRFDFDPVLPGAEDAARLCRRPLAGGDMPDTTRSF